MYPLTSPVLSVLVKYIHLWFELWDFAMESTCGHEPVEDNVFSFRISLNHPIEFFCWQFLPLCSSCCHLIITLVSEHSGARLSPVKAFPSPAFVGICLRSFLLSGPDLVRPLLCQARVNQGFSLCPYAPVWWWGASPPTLVWTCQLLSWGHSKQ